MFHIIVYILINSTQTHILPKELVIFHTSETKLVFKIIPTVYLME